MAKRGSLCEKVSSDIDGTEEFSIVGIGASAGGLEPITKLLGNLPAKTGLSFVVIQHLSADQESMLPEILARSTEMVVKQAKDGMQIEPDQVYVIPPGKTLTLKNRCIKLLPKEPLFKPINSLLVSLASDQKTRAIGIVLSGTGNDGTEGLKAIKAEGGITFVQDPATAQYPDMPRNAIAAGAPDFILSTEQIAKELGRIAKSPQFIPSEKVSEPEKAESELKKIIILLKSSFGVDFTHYRETTTNRRITRRMIISKTENMKDYVEFLRAHPNERQALFDDMLIGVTNFFREPNTFLALKEKVFPEMVSKKISGDFIRVWVPGCSTGEEVYSLAIELQEFLTEKELTGISIQIFGTDANEKNVEKARLGTYPKSIEDKVSENRLKRFFTSENGHYRIAKFIRDMCIFAKQDITTDPPFSNINLIMCRNVLIYFDTHLHERVLPIFHYALKPNGVLVLSESESVGKFQYLFEPILPKGLIYRKKQAQPQSLFGEGAFVPYSGKKTAKPIARADLLTVLGEQVDLLLTTKYGPATLLVNNNLDILVFRGDVGPYLSPESGTASLNVNKIIQKDLRSQVQTSIYRVRKEGKVFKETVHFKHAGQQKTVNIEITPLKIDEYDEPFYLVLFTEVPMPNSTQVSASRGVPGELANVKDRQIRELREDLEATKESLQTLVEGQEATNEELRSSMEEVQSSNEELQSTNEELETAKEELQSGNEELQTLNEELKNRNQALGRLNDDLANLQDNIDASVIIVDYNLRIRRFTDSAQVLLKISSSDVGQSITKIRAGISVTDLEKTITDVITKLTVADREVEGVGGRWYEMHVRPYLTEEKKIDGAVLSFEDITDRKNVADLVKSSEIRFRSLYESILDTVLLTKSDGSILSANPAACQMFGMSEEEIKKAGLKGLLFFDEKAESAFKTLQVNGKAKAELTLKCKDGSTFEGEVSLSVFTDVDGIVKNSIIVTDISERKKIEADLRESEEKFRILAEESPNMIFINQGGRVLYANKKSEEVVGYSREEFYSPTFNFLSLSPPEYVEAVKLSWAKHLKGEDIPPYEYVLVTKKGNRINAIISTKLINFKGKKAIMGIVTDITERKQTEDKLEDYKKNLERLVEERTKQLRDTERLATIGATAGMVGHDIRNPLQAITSDVYLVKTDLASSALKDEEKKDVIESLEEIEKNIVYINKIVQDLQDFARPLTPKIEEVDLYTIVDSALSTIKVPENITVADFFDKDLPKIKADPTFIQRIIVNLTNNAIQAMPNGGKLTISATRNDSKATIVVQDTGEGIPENVKSKIFTPLITTKAKGQGFGLAAVKRFTEAMGGTVSFESEPGKGTKFIIKLPV